MGTTVLVDFETFVKDLLPPLSASKLDIPSQKLKKAKATLFKLFYYEFDKDNKMKPRDPPEDPIAEAVVGVINNVQLPNGYKASLSRSKPDSSDPSRSKVDAALYPKGHTPTDDRPNWTHSRVYIEFKRGDKKYDPWEDEDGKSPEPNSSKRAQVRAQLIAYAHNTFLYQQRTALYSLFVIGSEFRAARWDRSGVIVSRKVDYVQETEVFLQFLWRLALLDDAQQGLDSTATLLKEDDYAYRLMDALALPNPSDVDHMEPDQYPPVPPTSTQASASVAPQNPSGATDRSNVVGASSNPGASAPGPPPDSHRNDRDGQQIHRTRSSSKAAAERRTLYDPDLATIEKVDGDPRVFRYVRQKFRDSLAPGWPRYKLRVGKENRVFLVGKPVFHSSSMFGRATRGYVAVDARTRRFVFLKDSWRPFYEDVPPEGTYLEMFSNDPSIIVPTFLCHGDVGAQQAYTAVYKEDPARRLREKERRRLAIRANAAAKTDASRNNKKRLREDIDDDRSTSQGGSLEIESDLSEPSPEPLRHHMHYRIVVKDVCLPFDCFRSSRQLVRLIYHCISTHYHVYTKYGLLHRDISAGNLLILPRHTRDKKGQEIVQWRGVLTDWELAKAVPADGMEDQARQPERTGTWQFMSVASVKSQWTIPIVVADELESFFHVMLFYGLRYLAHNISNVPGFVVEYFDTFGHDANGRRFCTPIKTHAVRKAEIRWCEEELKFLKVTGEEGNPINALFELVLTHFAARYEVLEHEKKVKTIEAQHATLRNLSTATMRSDTDAPDDIEEPWMDQLTSVPVLPTIPPLVKELDPDTVKLANALKDHKQILRLFGRFDLLEAEEWIDTGVTGVDLLAGYEPRPRLRLEAETEMGTTGTRRTDALLRGPKKARTDSEAGNSSFAAATHVYAESDSVLPSSIGGKGKGRA